MQKGEDAYDPVLPRAVLFPKNNEELSKILKICNRTESKAKLFSKELGYSSVKFEDFKKEIKKSDVVFFSTSSKTTLLNKSDLEKIMKNRRKNFF